MDIYRPKDNISYGDLPAPRLDGNAIPTTISMFLGSDNPIGQVSILYRKKPEVDNPR